MDARQEYSDRVRALCTAVQENRWHEADTLLAEMGDRLDAAALDAGILLTPQHFVFLTAHANVVLALGLRQPESTCGSALTADQALHPEPEEEKKS